MGPAEGLKAEAMTMTMDQTGVDRRQGLTKADGTFAGRRASMHHNTTAKERAETEFRSGNGAQCVMKGSQPLSVRGKRTL